MFVGIRGKATKSSSSVVEASVGLRIELVEEWSYPFRRIGFTDMSCGFWLRSMAGGSPCCSWLGLGVASLSGEVGIERMLMSFESTLGLGRVSEFFKDVGLFLSRL